MLQIQISQLVFFVTTFVCGFSSPITRTSFRSKSVIPIISPLTTLDGIKVYESATGHEEELSDLIIQPKKKVLSVFLTHLGDLSSWELAQKLVYYRPSIDDAGVKLVAIAPGATIESAAEFSFRTKFPLENLFLDPEAKAYDALKFEKGFMPNAKIDPYLKLLPMLAGIQSEGTIPEVLRGYFGDRNASPDWIRSTLRLVDQERFNVLGKNYQRPFELATVRLQNMIDILPLWDRLIPENRDLITQQGGAYIIDDKKIIYTHRDTGILKYVNVEDALQAASILV